jgi:hypothetical protein
MKKLMIGAAALALLTGCGQTDKPAEVAKVELQDLVVRKGDPAKAGDALAAMSLTDSGVGVLSFGNKKIDGATATFSDLTIAGEDGLKAGSLTFEGLDMAAGGATFGKMSLKDVVLTSEDDAEVKLGNLELINPSPELAGWFAASMNGQMADFPAVENVVFDSWTATDMSAAFVEDGMDGTFKIGKVEIRDMADLKAKKAMISGISFNGVDEDMDGPITFSLGSMTMTNVNAKFVKAMQENVGDEEAMMAAVMAAVYENPMDPGVDSLVIDDVKFDADGVKFDMPSLVNTVERNKAGQPVRYITKPYSATLKADADAGEMGAQLLQGLSMVGYEEMTFKGEGDASYDPDKDIFSFAAKKNYFELVDGAKFSFGGKLEGYGEYNKAVGAQFNFADMASGAEPDPDLMMEAMGVLTFHNLEISIDDNSLLDRAFNAAATSQGQDPAEMKAQINMGLAMAPMMAQGSGIDMALVTEMTGALGKFLSDGGTLTLKMDPKTPLAISDIMANPDPAAYTKDSLGFTATHK